MRQLKRDCLTASAEAWIWVIKKEECFQYYRLIGGFCIRVGDQTIRGVHVEELAVVQKQLQKQPGAISKEWNTKMLSTSSHFDDYGVISGLFRSKMAEIIVN